MNLRFQLSCERFDMNRYRHIWFTWPVLLLESWPVLFELISWRQLAAMYLTVITIVERDTGKHHSFIAECCYEWEARVTIPKAMNEWCFQGIGLYYGNSEFIVWQTCRMIDSCLATTPGLETVNFELSSQRRLSDDRMNGQEAYSFV